MKKDGKFYLRVLLGVLMVVLIVSMGIFFWPKKEVKNNVPEEEYVEEHPDRDSLYFFGRTYRQWEESLLRYYDETLGFKPSLRETGEDENGDLVIVFKDYNGDKRTVELIDVVTINHITGVITDQNGNVIEEKGGELPDKSDDEEYYDFDEELN